MATSTKPNIADRKDRLMSTVIKKKYSTENCDICLRVEEKTLFCHYELLANLSPFFRCYKKYAPDSAMTEFTLNEMDPLIMEIILNYVYTGRIIVRSNRMPDLIVAVDYLLMEGLLEEISRVLTDYLTIENVVIYFQLSENLVSKHIRKKTISFILLHLYQLNERSYLAGLKYSELKEILQDDRIVLQSKSGFLFGIYFKNYLIQLSDYWVNLNKKSEEQVNSMNDLSNIIERKVIKDRNRTNKYRYSEPIWRAYFVNQYPYGQHPPVLVGYPFNFRCLSRNIKRTFNDYSPDKWFVKKLVFLIIPDWNGVRAISDIDIEYKNYLTGERRFYKNTREYRNIYYKATFELMDSERITHITMYTGYLIYGMEMTTSFNRHSGIIGSRNGQKNYLSFPLDFPHALYFHGFAYLTVMSRGWVAINWVTIYGAILDKDGFARDFETGFDVMVKKSGQLPEKCWSVMNGDLREIFARLDISKPNPWLCEEGIDFLFEDMTMNYVEGLEIWEDELLMFYPIPGTVEEFLYQWRKYMRIMRLSALRQPESMYAISPFQI